MGAWGTGPFENDTALDWFTELEEENSFSSLLRKIEEVVTDDYLEADIVSEAVASIAIFAAIKSNQSNFLPEFESSSLTELRGLFLDKMDHNTYSLLEDAIEMIRRSDDNELYDLMFQSDDLEEWLAYLEFFEEKLND